MNWEAVLGAVWAGLNSPVGIAVIAGIVLWALNKLYAAKPSWAAYEGAIISAIRFAEKQIPDDTANTSMARFDAALRYVLRVFDHANERQATPKEMAALAEGIRIVHNKLDTDGVLGKKEVKS